MKATKYFDFVKKLNDSKRYLKTTFKLSRKDIDSALISKGIIVNGIDYHVPFELKYAIPDIPIEMRLEQIIN